MNERYSKIVNKHQLPPFFAQKVGLETHYILKEK
jgi:hypothetical protein